MRTHSRFNDEHEMTRWFIENLDLKTDVQIEVIQYGREMYFIGLGLMSNILEKRAVSLSINSLFMTDDELESELKRAIEHIKPALIDHDFLKDSDPNTRLIEDLEAAGVSEELLSKVLKLMGPADEVHEGFANTEQCNFSTPQLN